MTDSVGTPTRPTFQIQPLDQSGCWFRLATGTEGRIRLLTGTGVHSVVTTYCTYIENGSRGIMITVPAFNSLFQYALGCYVTLEVDGRDEDGGRWTVALSGFAREVHPTADDGCREPWPDSLVRRHLFVPGSRLAGSIAYPSG